MERTARLVRLELRVWLARKASQVPPVQQALLVRPASLAERGLREQMERMGRLDRRASREQMERMARLVRLDLPELRASQAPKVSLVQLVPLALPDRQA